MLDALRAELPDAQIDLRARLRGAAPADRAGFAHAVARARQADVCVAVLGDRAGLFGRGTSGEGCDAADLRLPGVQGELLDALLATGTPVVLVLLTGRPYALGRVADRLAAVVQAFFPGEEGGAAVAGVLSGRVNPTGRLPVERARARRAASRARTCAAAGAGTPVSSVDPTPLYPFGHGLSYTTFAYSDLALRWAAPASRDDRRPTARRRSRCTVRNTGDRAGDRGRPAVPARPGGPGRPAGPRLAGFARVTLAPGRRAG